MKTEKRVLSCPIAQSLDVFAGKWKPEILYHLGKERMRFNQLQRAVGGVSQKMLAQQLRELERDGLVKRIQFESLPPHVEYEATKLIETLEPIFDALEGWYAKNGSTIDRARKKYDKAKGE